MDKRRKSSSQSDKFVDAAREHGASEDADAFDKTLKRIAKAPPLGTVKDRKGKAPKKT